MIMPASDNPLTSFLLITPNTTPMIANIMHILRKISSPDKVSNPYTNGDKDKIDNTSDIIANVFLFFNTFTSLSDKAIQFFYINIKIVPMINNIKIKLTTLQLYYNSIQPICLSFYFALGIKTLLSFEYKIILELFKEKSYELI